MKKKVYSSATLPICTPHYINLYVDVLITRTTKNMIPVGDFNYTKLVLKLEDVSNFAVSLSVIEIVFLLLVNQMALIAPFINFSEAKIPVHRSWTR